VRRVHRQLEGTSSPTSTLCIHWNTRSSTSAGTPGLRDDGAALGDDVFVGWTLQSPGNRAIGYRGFCWAV